MIFEPLQPILILMKHVYVLSIKVVIFFFLFKIEYLCY